MTLVAVDYEEDIIPEEFYVSPNYPNPFNPSLNIDLLIYDAGKLLFEVYDLKGRMIKSKEYNYDGDGNYSIIWQPAKISSGIYFIVLNFNNKYKETKKVSFLK